MARVKVPKRDKRQEELDSMWDFRRANFRELLGDSWPDEDVEALTKREDIHPTQLDYLLKKGCEAKLALRILI